MRSPRGSGTNQPSNYNPWCRGVGNPIPSGFEFRFLLLEDLCIQDLFLG
jgi:hypothetical protein